MRHELFVQGRGGFKNIKGGSTNIRNGSMIFGGTEFLTVRIGD